MSVSSQMREYPPVFETLEPRLLLDAGPTGVIDSDPPVTQGAGISGDALWSDIGDSYLDELVSGNNAFAFDLYQQLRNEEGNLFFSPFSISSALAMTYAGARNRTAEQMADTLHFTLPQDILHRTFGELIGNLDATGADDGSGLEDRENSGDPFTLDIANSLWGQVDYPFLTDFLNTILDNYDAPLQRLDFFHNWEGSREIINDWVSDQTHERIKDLLKRRDIDSLTTLVLVNAVYSKGSWYHSFDERATQTQIFHLPDRDIDVKMMRQTEEFGYAEGETYQVVELPYVGGDMSMVITLPREGYFDTFEESLSMETMDAVLAELRYRNVRLALPKFQCEQELGLAEYLKRMGMPDAFDDSRADFSGMADIFSSVGGTDTGDVISSLYDIIPRLYISQVRHKGWIEVDEAGTEAAAATAVTMTLTTAALRPYAPPPVVFTADRPFIYTIRDRSTNSVLFVGRVSDASAFSESESDPKPRPKLGPGDVYPDDPGLMGLRVSESNNESLLGIDSPESSPTEGVSNADLDAAWPTESVNLLGDDSLLSTEPARRGQMRTVISDEAATGESSDGLDAGSEIDMLSLVESNPLLL